MPTPTRPPAPRHRATLTLPLVLLTTTIACKGLVGGPEDPNDPHDPNHPENPGPEPETGVAFFEARCASCHGAFAGSADITTGNANGDFRLDANAAVQRHGDGLAGYIDAAMPQGTPALCQGRCAELTAAYIRGRVRPVVPTNCDPNDTTTYGVRELKLLTSHEYQRSLEAILGVQANVGAAVANNDGALGGFANMRGKGINSATLESYIANAESVASWAVTNGRPFTCGGHATACANRFVDEFLFLAFRGPVSDDQRAAFVALFEAYPADGMRLALEAALTSPYFLYRVEAGVDLATALERGYYTNTGTNPGSGGGPMGAATERIDAAAFPPGSGRLDGDVWGFFENGAVELTFTAPFTDPTTLEVDARGTNHDAHWPELTVRVDGQQVGVARVDTTALTTYRFVVEGRTGTPRVRIEFNNDSGVPPYGPGQDANLFVASVRLVTTAAEPEPEPEPTPPGGEGGLVGVDADAYVLSPYELASALAFMLTGSTPDAPLLAAARADQLTTRAQIEAQVTRLIDSPHGREHFEDFVTQWFDLDEVTRAARPDVPEFTPAVKAAMVEEVRQHFAHVFYEDDAPYSEFFGGDYTFLNRTLADFYGVTGNFSDAFTKTTVEGRGGPIASGAFMAANAHVERTAPILRAVHSRQTALCHYIDPPNSPIAGEDIDAQRAAAQERVAQREQEGVLSSREFYFLYTDGIEACAGCHAKIINPMFGMEDFDHVGRLRPAAGAGTALETIRGEEVAVSLEGTLFGVDSTSDPATVMYSGAKDFSNRIAETDAVKSCLVRRGFRYATGLAFTDRDLDAANRESLSEEQREAYACIASRMTEALEAANDSPRAMFIALATESLLRLRR